MMSSTVTSYPTARRLPRWLAGLAAGLLLPAVAAASPTRALQSVEFTALGPDQVQLVLVLSEPAPEPVVFTVDRPARLSLDLPDTRLAMAERLKRINVGAVRTVAAASARDRTRVVVELTRMVPYSTRTDGNRIIVDLAGDTTATATAAPVTPTTPAAPARPRTRAGLSAVDFRRGERGEGRIIVTLSDPRTTVDVREVSGKVTARFRNAAVDDELVRRLDVVDFATPVRFVDTLRDGNDTRLVITAVAGAEFEHVAYQAGDQFTLELQPLTPERVEQRLREEPQYTGERISLSFQNVEVRALLQIIADIAGTNMVISDAVSGTLAMRLDNVPWDQALDIILRTRGLGMRQEGNVMFVAPLGELAERDRAERELVAQREELAPLRSELIQINYAKASEMAALLRAGDASMLSERGRVSVDDRTNTLLITETREKLAEIRELVSRLDIPVRQVLIESRIVIANDDFSRDLGARFGATAVSDASRRPFLTTTGTQAGADTIVQQPIAGFPNIVAVPVVGDRLNVNLPATPSAGTPGRIALAILGRDYLLDLELSALQAEGRGEVVSTPRVITANAKQAFVEQGREIPFQEATASGAASITFRKAVLSLSVTPQITPDERVIMDIAVTNDSQGENVSTGLGQAPSIDTRRLTTQVLVHNGETVVLGGVFEHDRRSSESKVPLLGDIPLLGMLFRNQSTSSRKRELLIFVTPKILQEGLSIDAAR